MTLDELDAPRATFNARGIPFDARLKIRPAPDSLPYSLSETMAALKQLFINARAGAYVATGSSNTWHARLKRA